MTDTPMTHLFAEPADVLLVRDGRPFSAGDDHHATGPFPPPPSAVYGALRSACLAQANADFRRPDFGLTNGAQHALGTKTTPGALALTALTLARRTAGGVERLWPVPAHVLKRKAASTAGPAFVRLAPTALPAGATGLPDGLLPLLPPPHPADTFYEGAGGYLTDADFDAVLAGGVPDALVQPASVFLREPRTQVSLRGRATADDGTDLAFTGTAQDGQLFSVDFVRMLPGTGLLLGIDGAPPGPAPPMLRLGGESRATGLEPVAAPDPPAALRTRAAASERLVLVLTTPCPSASGWRPEALEAEGLRLPGGAAVAARLVGAAVGRPETVGGWDVAERRPKPARRAAPAGSVFFLDGVADAAAVFDALDGRSLCLHPTDRAQGFGLVRVGVWS